MAALIAVTAGSFAAGVILLYLLRVRLPQPYGLFLTWPAGFLLWCGILLVAGCAGVLTPVILRMLTVVIIAVASGLLFRNRKAINCFRIPRNVTKTDIALLLLMAGMFFALLLCCFAPVTGGIENDEIHTHMSIPAFWLQHGKAIPQAHPVSFMAGNGELLFSWAMAFSREHGARVVSWFAFAMVVAQTFFLARKVVPRTHALAAAVMVTINPLLFRTSCVAFVDTLSVMFMLVSVNEYLRSREGAGSRALLLSMAFAGVGCGVKPTIVVYTAVLVAVATIDILYVQKRKRSAVQMATALLVLTVTAAPWPVTTLVRTGSPTFPPPPAWRAHRLDTVFRKGGAPFSDEEIEGFYRYVNSRYGEYRVSIGGFLRFPWDLTMDSGTFQAGDSVGTVFLSLFPLALFIAVRRRAKRALFLSFLAVLSSAGIYFGILPEARYFATACCLLAPLLALSLVGRSPLQMACGMVLMINVFFSCAVLVRTGSGRIAGAVNPNVREKLRSTLTPFFEAFSYCNTSGAGRKVVVCFDSPIWYYLENGYMVDSMGVGRYSYGMDTLLIDIDFSQVDGRDPASYGQRFFLKTTPPGMRLVFDGKDARVYAATQRKDR